MAERSRWKAKANIWKRAYDEEHVELADMRLRFEVEKKRADALEHNIGIAQQYAETAVKSANEREEKARKAELEYARLVALTVPLKPKLVATHRSSWKRFIDWL